MQDEIIMGLLVVIALAVGVLLARSFNPKYSGDIEVAENEEGTKVFSLVLYSDPEELEKMKRITFRVKTD